MDLAHLLGVSCPGAHCRYSGSSLRTLLRGVYSIHWIETPDHAWLCVTSDELARSGITPTRYSYHSRMNGRAYLEEDVDALAFLNRQVPPLNPNEVPIQVADDFEHVISSYALVPFASDPA